MMRTTVTLEPDLAKKVKALAHRRGLSFKQALNEALRRGLTAPSRRDARTRYTVEPHAGGFRPGIDSGKLNQLVDQLEAEELVAKAQR
jgi:predicted transcriptional regulator